VARAFAARFGIGGAISGFDGGFIDLGNAVSVAAEG